MRVAVVCPYDLGRFGGVQDQAGKLVRWLEDDGHEAWLVGPGTSGPDAARLVGPITVVNANGSATPITLSPAAWRATARAVEGADVVHIHEPFMPVVSQAASALSSAPTVGTFHADPSRAVRRLYKVAGPFLRRVVERLTVVTAVSPVAAAPLAGLAAARLVPNGIEVEAYRGGVKGENQVAFLGRDDPRKGLEVLLAAWPAVRAAVPSAHLVVAGVDAGASGRDGVTFVGPVDETRKREVLGRAAVFCAPNTGGESFGLVVAEAMAAGCAVVASAIPAFVHVAGEAAVLTKPSDAVALAEGVIALLTDPAKRHRMAALARERVGRFDRSAVLSGYLDAYRDALAGG